MARVGMTNIITELRLLTNASIDEWTDDQLEEVLDQRSEIIPDVQLIPVPRWYSGSYEYHEYHIPTKVPTWIEGPETQFDVVDHYGNIISNTTYVFKRPYRRIDFTTDTNGVAYFLRGVAFDLFLAASDVWYKKAAYRFEMIDIRGGNYLLREDQEYQHCLERAAYYAGKSGIKGVRLSRLGYNPSVDYRG